MNLGRAKTALIYTFLCLNIFLGYHLFLQYAGLLSQTVVTAADLQRTRSYLAAKNYILQSEINRTAQRSAFLAVAPAQQFLDKVIGYYISGTVFCGENEIVYYREPGSVLIVHPGGLIQLELQPGVQLASGPAGNMDDRELSRLVQQFLRDKNLLPEQARFDYIKREQKYRKTLHFYQDVDGTPLFAGYIRVIIELDHIISVELYWLDLVERPQEEELEVIPATDALMKLVQELGPSPQPRNITKIELGFFSREYNAEMWEIPPVWRILMEDGGLYYINAFTGNLEGDQEKDDGKNG